MASLPTLRVALTHTANPNPLDPAASWPHPASHHEHYEDSPLCTDRSALGGDAVPGEHTRVSLLGECWLAFLVATISQIAINDAPLGGSNADYLIGSRSCWKRAHTRALYSRPVAHSPPGSSITGSRMPGLAFRSS
jgi:hypothetical protein